MVDPSSAEDLERALGYLRGKTVYNGAIAVTDFQLDEAEQALARAAIVRLLGLPRPPPELLQTLAALFDDARDGMIAQGRHLVLKGRRRGPLRDSARDLSLIVEVKRRYITGISLEEAIAEAASALGMSESGLWDVWHRNPWLREQVLASVPRRKASSANVK